MNATFFAVLVLSITALSLGAVALPTEESLQGLYEGKWATAQGPADAEARLVAMGKGHFKLLVRTTADGETQRAELDGKLEDGALRFENSDKLQVTAKDEGVQIRGPIGESGTLDLKRVARQSPTLGKKPPEGAVVLIGPGKLGNMKPRNGEWGAQDDKDGSVQIPKGGMHSASEFDGSYDAHVEFQCNFRPEARSQGRGNSGCHLPCGQEIQVLDSFGMPTYLGGGCGGLYGKKDPDTMEPIPSLKDQKEHLYNLASLPPLAWQTYDIEYRLKPGDPKKGLLTVLHNGVKIHAAVELNHKPGAFHFQDHGNPVRYRNIWVVKK